MSDPQARAAYFRSAHASLLCALFTLCLGLPGSRAGNLAWTTSGPYAKSVKVILPHPTNPNLLYAGTFGQGVFKSIDGGSNWRQHRSGFRNSYVRSLALDSARPETLYAGTNDGIYRSTDGDSTWTLLLDTSILPTPTSVRAVALDRLHPGTVYAGTNDDGMFKSIDYGAHWTAIDLGLTVTSIRCIAIHPLNSDTVLIGTGTGGGVFLSSDAGASWTQSPDTAVNVSAAEQIVYDPLRTTRIFVASGSHGVIVSTNGGQNWKRFARGLSSFLTRSLAVVDTFRYVATDSSGVFYSTVSDSLWHPVNSGLGNLYMDALLARSAAEVWAGTDGGGIFRTANFGGLWSPRNQGLLTTDVRAVAVSGGLTHVYSATGLGDQFWASVNQGNTWIRTSALATHSSEYALASEPGSASVLYMAISNIGVLKSLDNGNTWADPAGTLGNLGLRALLSHPVTPGRLYVGAVDGVYKTLTGGLSWAGAKTGLPANAHIQALGSSPLKPDTMYAGTDSLGLYVSLNGGGLWTHAGAGVASSFIRSIACHPDSTGVVFAATDAGIFRSGNNGATWTTRNAGLPATASVRALAFDGVHHNVMFAGVWQGGVYMSGNYGASWSPLMAGLGSINVQALAVDGSRTTVFAGTDAGTYQYSAYGTSPVGVGNPGETSARFRSTPNPFLDEARIAFTLQRKAPVTLEVFDVGGRLVRRLLWRSRLEPGTRVVDWNGRSDTGSILPSGIYMARLSEPEGSQVIRLVLVR